MLALLNRHIAQPFFSWKAGNHLPRRLRILEQRQFDTPKVIAARQLESLREMLFHAWETVPFYRNRWQAAGVHPEDVRQLEDLGQFPILTKQDLRAHAAEIRSFAYADQEVFRKTTSGSTGVPLTIAVDREAMDWKRACTLRSDQWSGWRRGTRVARLWGHAAADRGSWKARLRRAILDRESYLNTLDMTAERMKEFAETLIHRPPGLIFGHAHSLYLFSVFVRKHFLGRIHPDGVISTAMLLHNWQRTAIEEAFGTPVTNRYGCEELSLIASECGEHDGLHLNADSVFAEVIPDATLSTEPGGGRLVMTDLLNRAMPLIRYQIGDVAVPKSGNCACGRGLPMLKSVTGREADYVLAPDGRLISGISLTDHYATEIRGATQVQLVQESRSGIRLRIVPDERFDVSSRERVAILSREFFGPEMRADIELVDRIPQEPSGKYRFCISPVAVEHIRAMGQ
ncbi:phenylacetate--CoA ligase family protein [Zavarzinella formosa]|uniref:phenylacetate--CoA ligase family protein n=1 Tax=Zavarzinella formosa TaxID=360055 RepID=UPI000318FF37|nr:phenylacetate--CoA ligase family protein [Zavarzinella formosa]